MSSHTRSGAGRAGTSPLASAPAPAKPAPPPLVSAPAPAKPAPPPLVSAPAPAKPAPPLLGGSVEPTPPEPFAFPVLESDGPVVTVGTPIARADEVVREAMAAAARITAQAEAEGRERGYAAGLEEGRAAVAAASQALEEAVGGVVATRAEYLDQAEARAAELALLLAEKIIGAALDVRPELVLELVRGALRRAVERDHLVIEVNPADLELVRAEADEVAARLGGVRQLEVVAEARVAPGGCVVRTTEGEIDARIETQLERAGELLRDSLAARFETGTA